MHLTREVSPKNINDGNLGDAQGIRRGSQGAHREAHGSRMERAGKAQGMREVSARIARGSARRRRESGGPPPGGSAHSH